MLFEIINNVITADGPLRKPSDEPTYSSPGNQLYLSILTHYKSDGNISISTYVNKTPVPFTMTDPMYVGTNEDGNEFVKYDIEFTMPPGNVIVSGSFTTKWEEREMDKIKENAEKVRTPGPDGVIDTFTIPEELAQELSDLLIKQSIRQNTVNSCVGDPEKYGQAEAMLIPITAEIDKIKYHISTELVPKKYRSSKYRWNFNGWEIDNNVLQILYA